MIKLFIDNNFIKAYVKRRPKADNVVEFLHWSEFIELILKSHVSLYNTSLNMEIKRHDLIRLIEQPHKLDRLPDVFYKIKRDYKNYFALYFLDIESERAYSLQEKYGLLFLNPDMTLAILPKLNVKSFIINKEFDWREIEQMRHPNKFIIFNDPYLLSQTEAEIESNIVKFLSVLLFSRKEKHIDVTFFCFDGFNNQKISPKTFEKKILNKFAHKYNISLGVVAFNYHNSTLKKTLHDRIILTNYFQIKSGHSFKYFDRNLQITISTTLDFESILNEDIDKTMHKILSRYKNLLNDQKHNYTLFGHIAKILE